MQRSKSKTKKAGVKKIPSSEKSLFAPTSVTSQFRYKPPQITSSNGEIRIKHREYLMEVVSHTDADQTRLHTSYVEANPGLYSTCPWLSAIANRFESYTFNNLSLCYVPSCATTTPGSVILAPDYDVSDYSPESVMVISTYPGAVRTTSWAPVTMNCEPKLLQKLVRERMIRSGTISDVDLKLYDSAVLYICTVGHSALANIGSVWIEYDVTLRTPSIDTEVASADSVHWQPDGVSKAEPLGTGGVIADQDEYTPILDYDTETTLKLLRPGRYLLTAHHVGTGLAEHKPTVTLLDGTVDATSYCIGNGAGTYMSFEATLEALKPTLISFVSNALWTTLTSLRLKLTPYGKGAAV